MSAITILILFIIILFLTVLIEGWYIFLLHKKLNQIGIDKEGKGLLGHIVELSKSVEQHEQKIDKLFDMESDFQEKSLFAYQKIGYVRFNPFDDLGGDHSFSVALLDGHFSGILITGLHTRDRTRVYMKEVKEGSTTQSLSKEEQKALQKALELKH